MVVINRDVEVGVVILVILEGEEWRPQLVCCPHEVVLEHFVLACP